MTGLWERHGLARCRVGRQGRRGTMPWSRVRVPTVSGVWYGMHLETMPRLLDCLEYGRASLGRSRPYPPPLWAAEPTIPYPGKSWNPEREHGRLVYMARAENSLNAAAPHAPGMPAHNVAVLICFLSGASDASYVCGMQSIESCAARKASRSMSPTLRVVHYTREGATSHRSMRRP